MSIRITLLRLAPCHCFIPWPTLLSLAQTAFIHPVNGPTNTVKAVTDHARVRELDVILFISSLERMLAELLSSIILQILAGQGRSEEMNNQNVKALNPPYAAVVIASQRN